MNRWDRSPDDQGQPDADTPRRAASSPPRVHEPHRWRREDRPTTPAEWEVQEFYQSFDAPRP